LAPRSALVEENPDILCHRVCQPTDSPQRLTIASPMQTGIFITLLGIPP
jgi:hypothetical protein